ncbi:MAG TPA: energy transducer TonB [Acidobacteriaceae bacterium]|nr:energy transducer TonB [Acidobacteriaceae bacterium]
MFLASQLTEISSRFSGHVQEIRGFLLKEKLPVDSPEAIPQLSKRLETDVRFRADVASLMRAILYEEREGIGYEDLLGILVTAAAGSGHDLKSDSQEADVREMLRFLLQSRRSTFQPESELEETTGAVEAERREAAPAISEPVLLARGVESAPFSNSKKLELKPDEPPVAVVEADGREAEDVVLSPFRTGGLFAAQQEPEASWWRNHAVWIVGVVCMLVGVGLGLMFHRVVSAAEMHVAVRASSSPNKPKMVRSIAPMEPPERLDSEAGSGAAQTAPVTQGDQAAVQPAAVQVGSVARGAQGSAVPMTVVKQVVTASSKGAPDSGGQQDVTQSSAKTRSIVPQGAAGITPASVIFSPAPEYPADAAAARVHGQVTVHAVVDPDGNVIYARAVSGPPLLRDAAQQAVQRWRYSPLLDNGKPIAVTTTAILDFKFAK